MRKPTKDPGGVLVRMMHADDRLHEVTVDWWKGVADESLIKCAALEAKLACTGTPRSAFRDLRARLRGSKTPRKAVHETRIWL